MWAELSLLTGVRHLAIEFSGPAAAPSGVDARREWSSPCGAHSLSVSLGEPDLFHRSELGRALLARSKAGDAAPIADLPDAFVLFNPGLGEPGWERAWRPTLRALEAAERPLLMTALSSHDAERDLAFIEAMEGRTPWLESEAASPYLDNPFGSLLGVDDSLNSADGNSATAQSASQGDASSSKPTPSGARFYVSSRPSNTHYRVLVRGNGA